MQVDAREAAHIPTKFSLGGAFVGREKQEACREEAEQGGGGRRAIPWAGQPREGGEV